MRLGRFTTVMTVLPGSDEAPSHSRYAPGALRRPSLGPTDDPKRGCHLAGRRRVEHTRDVPTAFGADDLVGVAVESDRIGVRIQFKQHLRIGELGKQDRKSTRL